ncbi:hypothetical protein OAD30_04665 [Alphaproteobacteria bacterium]|nr:hypothetical protein [Alphaproteobacteria bacterium]
MNINKYKELSVILETILLSTSTPEIIANNYLHFVNSHPQSLKKYGFSKMLRIKFSIRSSIIVILRLFFSILKKKLILKKSKTDIIFVSHLTNSSQKLQENDAYFGNLPTLLAKYNISSNIALINHIKSNFKISDVWKKSLVPRFILNNTLRFKSEFELCICQIKSKKELVKILHDLNGDKIQAKNILNHHFSSETFNAIRIAKQVAWIAKRTGADFIFTTYEGHAWERLVYYYARKINPKIKCFGYQHAAISKHNYAINQSLQYPFNPDVIFTSGMITKQMFDKNKQIRSEITCLGSFKNHYYNLKKNTVNSCLVIPEGILSECLLLFKLSLEYAKQHKNQKFIWRLHPILNFNILKKKFSLFKNLPDNIYVSERNLDADIEQCNTVLYRGSTSVFRAISAGLSPIYFQKSIHELSVDPLCDIMNGKLVVSNISSLHFALHKKFSAKHKTALQKFSLNYFNPIDINKFLDIYNFYSSKSKS